LYVEVNAAGTVKREHRYTALFGNVLCSCYWKK